MDAKTTKLTSRCTKLERDSIIYYFLPHITFIVKNDIITVQSSSQQMLLERLTTPERGIYNIDFATLDIADRFGQTNSVELVEYWVLNDYFVFESTVNIPSPLDVNIDGQPIETEVTNTVDVNITNTSIAVTLDEPIDVNVTNTPTVTISGTVPVSFSQPISVTDVTATLFDTTSTLRSYTNTNIATVALNQGIRYACLGIKVLSGTIDLVEAIWTVSTAVDYIAEIWLNPTVAGTFTYNTFGTIQVANGVSTNIVTGGTRLFTRFGLSRADVVMPFIIQKLRITTSDTVLLVATGQTNTNASIYTAINYRI